MSTNKVDKGLEAAAAPVLSPEFLGGSTEAGLDKIRTRLLDLTNRNRLLNFRHPVASSLRAVDTNLNSVFTRLLDGEKLEFMPVPEPDPDFPNDITSGSETKAKPAAVEYAKRLLEDVV